MSRSLRILVHGLNFSPDLVGIPKYTAEMAEWLSQQGHSVRVVTAPPYYPAWQITPGYSGKRYTVEWQDKIKIVRCPLWVPRVPTGLKRLLHLASFALSSFPAVIYEALRFRPDIIWTVQPALFATPGTLVAAKFCGARSWMHVQDLEIDAAFQLGLLNHPSSRHAALAFHRAILRRFDHISSISPGICRTLIEQGASPERTSLVRNWVDTTRVFPDDLAGARLRESLNISPDAVVALYSGSMGNKQGLSIIIDAARQLAGKTSGHPRVYFLICGEGTYRRKMEELAGDLDNVKFLPLQPAKEFNALLSAADIHLLPQRANVEDLVLPSKLGGMMASARPIIVAARPESFLAQIVTPCGLVVPPEELDALVAAIATLALNADLRKSLGGRGVEAAENDWSVGPVLRAFEAELLKISEDPTPPSRNLSSAKHRTLAARIKSAFAGGTNPPTRHR